MRRESVAFQLRMKPEIHEALAKYSQLSGESMNSIINEAVLRFLTRTKRARDVTRLMEKAQKDYRVALDKLADL